MLIDAALGEHLKVHQFSWHVSRSGLNCSTINTAIMGLWCCAPEVGTGDIPHLQCSMIRILAKGTYVLPDAFSALLQPLCS